MELGGRQGVERNNTRRRRRKEDNEMNKINRRWRLTWKRKMITGKGEKGRRRK
jgi:hypothetical protein